MTEKQINENEDANSRRFSHSHCLRAECKSYEIRTFPLYSIIFVSADDTKHSSIAMNPIAHGFGHVRKLTARTLPVGQSAGRIRLNVDIEQ